MGTKHTNEFFETIRDALQETVTALRDGKMLTRREVSIPDPPAPMTASDIVKLREVHLGVSQHVFAQMLNVAPQTVQAWEQGRNSPAGATLKLLRIAVQNPSLFLESIGEQLPVAQPRFALRPQRANGCPTFCMPLAA